MDNNYIKKILGTNIRELRLSKGYTQEQLAEYLNLQPHTINRLETGKNFVSCEVLANLCECFNVAPAVFFNSKPQILSDEHIDYSQEIHRLLPAFSTDKLRELYNIMLVLKNN